jgi:putative endonuclease
MSRKQKQYFVYIMASPNNKALYTGITVDIIKRVFIHKSKMADGFTKRYNITKLVYYEVTDDVRAALEREKQIKAGSRKKKDELINSMNPFWDDLYGKLFLIN